MKALENIHELYAMYLSGQYDCFFRHFEPFLNITGFTSSLESSVKVLELKDGYVVLRFDPRTRIADISVILPENAQGDGGGLKAMLEVGEMVFKDYGASRVVVITSCDDRHTNEICEKGGFDLEAVHKRSCFYGHRLHDENRWIMTREKYFKDYGG